MYRTRPERGNYDATFSSIDSITHAGWCVGDEKRFSKTFSRVVFEGEYPNLHHNLMGKESNVGTEPLCYDIKVCSTRLVASYMLRKNC